MSIKVYTKKGNTNYKEKKLVRSIEKAIDKLKDDPKFQAEFKPATNYQELEALHNKYCVTDVEFEEVSDDKKDTDTTDTYEKHKEFMKGMSTDENKDVDIDGEEEMDDAAISDISPMNREEPIVRDYVMDDGFKEDDKEKVETKTSFEEPTNFGESFSMPNSEDKGKDNKGPAKEKQPKKEEPFNPQFNEMDNGKKKRSTKKFAKYIVEAVCMLAEKGFIWYTTKEINEAKVAEYEIENTLPLEVLLTMDGGQEITVRQWFKDQCLQAEQLAKFEQDEKDDLADVLAEVLMKKGFAPTAEQELAMIALKMFGQKVLVAIGMKKGIDNVISQLKALGEPKQTTHTHTHTETTTTTDTDTDFEAETAENVGNPAVSNELTVTK